MRNIISGSRLGYPHLTEVARRPFPDDRWDSDMGVGK